MAEINTKGLPDKGKDEKYYHEYFTSLEADGHATDVDLAKIRYRQGHALLEARKACKKKGSWSKFLTSLNLDYSTAYAYIRVARDVIPEAATGKTWTALLAMVFPSFKKAPEPQYEPDADKPAKKSSTIKKALSQSKTSKDLEVDEDEDDLDEEDLDEDDSESSNREPVKLYHAIEEFPSTNPGEPAQRGIVFPEKNPQACSGWLDAVIADIANAYAMAKDCPESERDGCKAKVNVALANLEKVTRRLDDPSYSAELSA